MSTFPTFPSSLAAGTPDATAGAHDPRSAADVQSAAAEPVDTPDTSAAAGVTTAAHSPHPAALRERAVTLFCEGHRSPAIATQLAVPERTVRAWLADARRAFLEYDDTADAEGTHGDGADRTDRAARAARMSRERIALAVERQLAIAAAAWQSYHHARELEQLALDHHRLCMEWYRDSPGQPGNAGNPMPPAPPRPSTPAPVSSASRSPLSAKLPVCRAATTAPRPRPSPPSSTTRRPASPSRLPRLSLTPLRPPCPLCCP